jgi:hypothetical protein
MAMLHRSVTEKGTPRLIPIIDMQTGGRDRRLGQ